MPTRFRVGLCIVITLVMELIPFGNEAVAGPFGRRCGCRRVVCVRACCAPDVRAALRPNLEDGVVFYSLFVTSTEGVMKVMGQEIRQKQDQAYSVRWKALGLDCEGNWILDAKILATKMRLGINGIAIEFDTRDPRLKLSSNLGFVTLLLGADLRFHVQQDGKVKKLEGTDTILKEMEARSPNGSQFAKSILNETALVRFAGRLLEGVPPRPVFPGESWESTRTLDAGSIGAYREDSLLAYLGRAGSLQRIRVESTLSYQPEKSPKIGDLSFQIKSAEVKGSTVGQILFDPAKMRIAERTTASDLAGKLIVEVGGLRTEVELRQTQNERLVFSDTNPTWPPPAR